jgi:hypothetical protein
MEIVILFTPTSNRGRWWPSGNALAVRVVGFGYPAMSGPDRGFIDSDWLTRRSDWRKPHPFRTHRFSMAERVKLRVEVVGDEIVVTMPGTNFMVRYERAKDRPGLVATSFGGRKDHGARVSLPTFLAQAWQAANDKARELRWRIV